MTSSLPFDPSSDEVVIASRALFGSGWACAPKKLSREEVEAALDAAGEQYIPGTPWTVVTREHDDPELCSPGRCAHTDDRQHWLLLGGITGVFCMAGQEDTSGFDPTQKLRTGDA